MATSCAHIDVAGKQCKKAAVGSAPLCIFHLAESGRATEFGLELSQCVRCGIWILGERAAAHAAKCARQRAGAGAGAAEASPPWIVPGCNARGAGPCQAGTEPVLWPADCHPELQALYSAAYVWGRRRCAAPVQVPASAAKPAAPSELSKHTRHATQASRMLDVMQGAGLLQPDSLALELGAGKAMFAVSWMERLNHAGSSCLLVDRAAMNYRGDRQLRKMQGQGSLASFGRLTADLADFDAAHYAWSTVAGCARSVEPLPVVGVAKHLCGAATDMALLCMRRACLGTAHDPLRMAGMAIATCCMHRCTWQAYSGRAWWREALAGGQAEFEAACRAAAWAALGPAESRKTTNVYPDQLALTSAVLGHDVPAAAQASSACALQLLPTPAPDALPGQVTIAYDRRAVGQAAKFLIDSGRLAWLSAQFLAADSSSTKHAALVQYCPPEITPMNTMLVISPHACE